MNLCINLWIWICYVYEYRIYMYINIISESQLWKSLDVSKCMNPRPELSMRCECPSHSSEFIQGAIWLVVHRATDHEPHIFGLAKAGPWPDFSGRALGASSLENPDNDGKRWKTHGKMTENDGKLPRNADFHWHPRDWLFLKFVEYRTVQ